MVVPILKKNGDMTSKNNYRLIAIATVMEKESTVLFSNEIRRSFMDNWCPICLQNGRSVDMCLYF